MHRLRKTLATDGPEIEFRTRAGQGLAGGSVGPRGPAPTLSAPTWTASAWAPRPAPGLAEIHRAHATTIAFENFDPYAGLPVSLDPGTSRTSWSPGAGAATASSTTSCSKVRCGPLDGVEVSPILARVRLGPEGAPRPLNHLLLRVSDARGTLAGRRRASAAAGSWTRSPSSPARESEQSGWRYRLAEDGPELVLQVFQDGGWNDMYGFVAEPAEPIDIVVNNWFTSTHPQSDFVKGIMAGCAGPSDACRFSSSSRPCWWSGPSARASAVTEVPSGGVPGLLAERFGIEGVALRDDGDLTLAV